MGVRAARSEPRWRWGADACDDPKSVSAGRPRDERGSWPWGAGVLLAVTGGGVAALWLRFNAAPPAQGKLFPHDLVYYFYPQLDQVAQRFSAGELPLWNPYPCAGLPLAASLQAGVFYPPTWLAAFVPAAELLPALLLAHLVWGALSAALLFRSWGLAPSLAGAFGVVFAFACVLGQTFWPPAAETISWLPWPALCVERISASDRLNAWWIGLVLGTAAQLLVGFPQFAFYGLQLLVPLAALRLFQRLRDRGLRDATAAAGRLIAAFVLAAGIAMVQLLPSFELLSTSHRAEPFSEAEVHYLQSEPRASTLLRHAVTPEPRLTTFELGQGAGYLGIATLVFAGIALVGRRRDPLVWLLGAGAVLFLLLSDGYLGAGRGLYELYAALPGVGYFRAPERLLMACFACVIALAAMGAHACDRAGAAEPRLRLVLAGTAALVCGGLAWAGTSGAAWRAAGVFGWIAVLQALPRSGWLRGPWRTLAALLIVTDVAAATGPFGSLRALPRDSAEHVELGRRGRVPDATIAALRERSGLGRVELVAPGQRVRPLMGVGAAGGLYRLACYETLLPGQWALLSEKAGRRDFRSAVAANLDPAKVPVLYDAASVVEILRGSRPRGSGQEPIQIQHLPNPDALPRAYLIDRFEVTAVESALDRLVAGDLDPQHSVLLDADPGLAGPPRLERAVPAEIRVYEPERVEVSYEISHPALLVLTDTDAPGWHASIAGEPLPILRANGLFRAVAVPAGRHELTFRYAPESLRVGTVASATAIAIAALAFFRRRKG